MSAVQYEGVNMATTPAERAVMAALAGRGHYSEEPDAFLWANHDATNVVRCLDELGHTHKVAWDALTDTGLHYEDDDDEMACLNRDVEAVRVALAPFHRDGDPT